MVELDVQLSKDMVPVIYHDYFVNISMKKVIVDCVIPDVNTRNGSGWKDCS